MTIIELKASVYDHLVQIEILQNNVKELNRQLQIELAKPQEAKKKEK